MPWTAHLLWLIPFLPLAAAAAIAVSKQSRRTFAAALTIGAQSVSCLLALTLLLQVLRAPSAGEDMVRRVLNFTWFEFGSSSLQLGLLLDPLNAAMLVMVTFVGLLICIFSVGYMSHDANFTRFFGFLSLFSAAMLGLLVSNSLLLLFICWELVGLASYLLIGFWYHKPSAAAAAKKAFITTRIGDLGFFLGMIWLYAETGTLLFYDGGAGVLDYSALTNLATGVTVGGMALSTAIALLLFCGAAGKSGQFPLHVWLPDAMEGPTPVSALIHAATMVAAGVFMVARVFPIFAVTVEPGAVSTALIAVTWVGAFTAVFAACIAVAQTDIKRILAYSTVSQLGFMMLALGVGGVAAAMFHLIAHAFFKALLFLGAGSVIHGCHNEQDIRKMGGVRRFMPTTFAAYAIGMMALAGFPFFFSGFWSKEEILHLAHGWPVSQLPFYFALAGTFLTAFYMSRQMFYVFFGNYRNASGAKPHESPRVMTIPLMVLAGGAILLGLIATPAWPWFHHFIDGGATHLEIGRLFQPGAIALMILSIVLVGAGVGAGWWVYGRTPLREEAPDPLEARQPALHRALSNRLYVDEFYEATVIRLHRIAGQLADLLDRFVWNGVVVCVSSFSIFLSNVSHAIDRLFLNHGFDSGCEAIRQSGARVSGWHKGNIQTYLGCIGAGMVLLIVFFAWM
ncbi:MAG: NADH-quinone oxidoreductase subunit L [Opitutales bacterium]